MLSANFKGEKNSCGIALFPCDSTAFLSLLATYCRLSWLPVSYLAHVVHYHVSHHKNSLLTYQFTYLHLFSRNSA